MPEFFYDFHIHSCLSPCGSDDMTPADIAGMACINGLDVIALTDHNTCKNCPAIIEAAKQYEITVLPGMELTVSEEIHILCLFNKLEEAMSFDSYVYENLPDIKNNEKIFGNQIIMDENDCQSGTVDKLLINATKIGFDYLPKIISEYNGIMIPAHINKNSDSILSVFGSIPPSSSFVCAEINKCDDIQVLIQKHPYLSRCRIISDSDAHYFTDIHERVHSLSAPGKDINDIFNTLKGEI